MTTEHALTPSMRRILAALDRGSATVRSMGNTPTMAALKARDYVEHGGASGWRLTYAGRMAAMTLSDNDNAAEKVA